MILGLKGKLKRLDSGLSREAFAILLTENLIRRSGAGPLPAEVAGSVEADGTAKPLFAWDYRLYLTVMSYRATLYMVRPEYEDEVIGTLLMLLETRTGRVATVGRRAMNALALTLVRALVYPAQGMYADVVVALEVRCAKGTRWLIDVPKLKSVKRRLTQYGGDV